MITRVLKIDFLNILWTSAKSLVLVTAAAHLAPRPPDQIEFFDSLFPHCKVAVPLRGKVSVGFPRTITYNPSADNSSGVSHLEFYFTTSTCFRTPSGFSVASLLREESFRWETDQYQIPRRWDILQCNSRAL